MTKVLIVDDDAETRLIIAGYLAQLGVEHSAVESVGDCLAKLVKDPDEFDVVFMDIHMPSLSGVDATSWIRESEIDPPRNIPIFALTGDELFHDDEYISKIGMAGYVPKPITLEKLEAAIQFR